MPVDPLEEARERLEAAVARQTFIDGRGVALVGAGDLTAILAELDRRSPPTGEGLSPAEAFDLGFAWRGMLVGQALEDGRAVGRTLAADIFKIAGLALDDAHVSAFVDAGTAICEAKAAIKRALAAAPPPPDEGRVHTTGYMQVLDGPVPISGLAEAGRMLAGPDISRGLDREGVAREIWNGFAARHGGAFIDAKGTVARAHCEAIADAIIALSAPAGGGLEVEQQYSSLRSAPQPALGGKPPLDEPASAAGAWRPTHRHVKRGTSYQVVGMAAVQSAEQIVEGDTVVVYRAENGMLWVRPLAEFFDGRFTPVANAPADTGRGE